LFENCAAGGKRTDLGIMKYFNHTWVSDWQVAPSSFAITNGMTMVLPPEYVDRLASGMNCHTKASLDFQIRQTLFGKPTTNSYNSQYSNYNEMQIEFAKHTYDIYKDFVRPYAKDAKIYHHTPEIDCAGTQGIGILERASADRSKSMIGVFKLANNLENPPVIYPRGIRADGEYLVKFDNLTNSDPDYKGGVVSGYDLCNNGLRVNLKGSMISELILIEKIK
jgi:alpha-galactosidase